MDYFEKKLEEQGSEKLPEWVNKSNKSYDAYKALHRLKSLRLEFIRTHNNKTDFKTPSRSHQIRAAQVARDACMSKVTLTSTSSYSSKFKKELEKVNAFLAEKKAQHFKELDKKKNEIQSMKSLRKTQKMRATDDEKALIERQVTKALDYLNSDIKEILLLPSYRENKILKIQK
tara:strand:- start:438 stop:959 length:522 start_codon:yes stop_codon:yes gene_type:complete